MTTFDIPSAVHIGAYDLPFVELPDGSQLKVIQVKEDEGLWIVENVFRAGYEVHRHKHTGPVYAYTTSGAWRRQSPCSSRAQPSALRVHCSSGGSTAGRGFTAAMMLGIVVGTYSSVYVSSSLLITLGLKPQLTDKKSAKGIAGQGERVTARAAGDGSIWLGVVRDWGTASGWRGAALHGPAGFVENRSEEQLMPAATRA